MSERVREETAEVGEDDEWFSPEAVRSRVEDAPIPTVDDYQMLADIDAFNAKVKAAVSEFRNKGYGPRTTAITLRMQLDVLTDHSPETVPLVSRFALREDEQLGRARPKNQDAVRAALAQKLHAAGAMKTADRDTLRKKLSDMRRNYSRCVLGLTRASLLELVEEYEAEGKPSHEEAQWARDVLAQDNECVARLRELGVFDLALYDLQAEDPDECPSESGSDTSESGPDASESGTDG